jgi:hypothetical protein
MENSGHIKRARLSHISVWLGTAIIICQGAVFAGQQTASLAGFRISQYDLRTGIWSDPVNSTGGEVSNIVDWNALMYATLVVAEVQGNRESYEKDLTISLSASQKGKIIDRRVLKSIYFAKDGKYFVPIMLYGPFCDSVRIKFELKRATQSLKQQELVLPFACGE